MTTLIVVGAVLALVGGLIWRLVYRAGKGARSDLRVELMEANQVAATKAERILDAEYSDDDFRALAERRRRLRDASSARLHDNQEPSDPE